MSNDRKYRDIYVIGDIHGDWQGFMSVVGQMLEDGFDWDKDLLVQLGDMVDGYPYSYFVVSWLKAMKELHPHNLVVLKGNHDQFMIEGSYDDVNSDAFALWWNQGGASTWESYWKLETGEDNVYATQPYLNLTPGMVEHIEWFKTLPTMFQTEDYYFVHAGLNPHSEGPWDTSDFARMWIRGPFLRSDRMWDKMVVHGHSPVPAPEVKPNRINVNTRPRHKGYVSGARLSNDGSKKVERFFKPSQDVIDAVNESLPQKKPKWSST